MSRELIKGVMVVVAMNWATALLARAELVDVVVDNLFVPAGFDDNDEVVVVINGFLPNSCYKLAGVVVTRSEPQGVISVRQQARIEDGMCLQALVPFTSSAIVGSLDHGHYKVVANGGSVSEPLNIEKAIAPSVDDYHYAPVERAWVEPGPAGRFFAHLEGLYTNSCLKTLKVKLVTTGRTIQVLPLVAVEERPDCVAGEFPFVESIELPYLRKGRYLLHVRSMNGAAVNSVFSIFNDGNPY